MIKANEGSISYRAYFRYHIVQDHLARSKKERLEGTAPKVRIRRSIECYLEVKLRPESEWIRIGYGRLSCDSRDPFRREKGRKAAFTQAVNEAWPHNEYGGKKLRTMMWKAYGEQTNKTWAIKKHKLVITRESDGFWLHTVDGYKIYIGNPSAHWNESTPQYKAIENSSHLWEEK